MDLLDPNRRSIWTQVSQVSSSSACIEFDPPVSISKRDIERFEVRPDIIQSFRSTCGKKGQQRVLRI